MTKTQVYLTDEDLAALHREARRRNVKMASLVREAIRETYLRPPLSGPVAIWDGPFDGTSSDHDSAFDEP